MERLGIAFSGGASPAEIVECVKLAEALGYESAWVAEGHGGDQFAVLAACARETSRIGLGTAITSVFVRTAPTIAMAAATVDDVSGGRFILGIGSSHKVQVEAEHGGTYREPPGGARGIAARARLLCRIFPALQPPDGGARLRRRGGGDCRGLGEGRPRLRRARGQRCDDRRLQCRRHP